MRHPWYLECLAPGIDSYNATLVAKAKVADSKHSDNKVIDGLINY